MRRFVLPVPVVRHSAVLIIAPVTEHSGTLGHFALVDLALGGRKTTVDINIGGWELSHLVASLLVTYLGLHHCDDCPTMPQCSRAPFPFFKSLSLSQHSHSLTFKAFSQTKISREIVYSGPPLLLEAGHNI